MSSLIAPHGGELKNLYLSSTDAATEEKAATDYQVWKLTHRQVCDIELLLSGGFSPLDGFMSRADYNTVVEDLHLADGTLWPMPITLDIDDSFATSITVGEHIALVDQEGTLVATMEVSDKWQPNKSNEAAKVFGADDLAHPAVAYLHNEAGNTYIGGKLKGIRPLTHYDYKQLRDTPTELRAKFEKWGWKKIVAFQTRNPMHRAHQELTFRAAQEAEANLIIQPVVGMTKPGDIDHHSRVRCYQHIIKQYPAQTTTLSLLPLAMRMGGPREAVWHAIIRKNYGCTHFIVGRDHAGPGKNSQGEDFYGPYEAQEMVTKYQDELGIQMVPFQMMVYVENKAEYHPITEVDKDESVLNISGTEFRRRLQEGLDIPEWFSYSEVVAELRKTHPPKHKQGFVIFLTGLSGAGKSTIANALLVKFLEMGGRKVTLLDGDVVRENLSDELGFTKADRDKNIKRIAFVAKEIAKNGGIAICAPIAPYAKARNNARKEIKSSGGFLEIYVSTPLEVCEARDPKGLYAKARAGRIEGFTGVSDPYETPESPDLAIDTQDTSAEEAAQRIILKLEKEGLIK